MLSGLFASHATAALVFMESSSPVSIGYKYKQLACQPAPNRPKLAQSNTCTLWRHPLKVASRAMFLIRHSLCLKNEAARAYSEVRGSKPRSRGCVPDLYPIQHRVRQN